MNARTTAICMMLYMASLASTAGAQEAGTLDAGEASLAQTAGGLSGTAVGVDGSRRPARLSDAMAVSPKREWTPSLNPGSRSEMPLDRALRDGESALSAGNLLGDASSALSQFRTALTLDAANATALSGIERVADALYDRARAAHAEGDRDGALSWLNELASIRPGHGGMKALRGVLAHENRLGELFAEAAAHMESSRFLGNDGRNAVATYHAILELDAENSLALDALAGIESLLLAEVSRHVQALAFDEADRALERAEKVRGRSDAVTAAAEAIAMSRQQQFTARRNEVVGLVAVGDFELALSSLESLVASGYSGRIDDLQRQIDEGQRLLAYVPGTPISDPLEGLNSAKPLSELVIVGRGEVLLGSPDSEPGRSDREGPQHRVRFARPFAMGRYEVTVGEFRQFVEATDYVTDAERSGKSEIFDGKTGGMTSKKGVNWRHDFAGRKAKARQPVIHVSHNDAVQYTRWLSDLTGKRYRLPTESEFEYALRGGTASPYWWGEDSPPDRLENLTGDRDMYQGFEWPVAFGRYGDGHWGPAPVGSFEANPFGLHDMGGNVAEWVADCYNDSYANTPDNGAPSQVGKCNMRVVRGASWANPPEMARSAYRTAAGPQRGSALVGFRLVREL